MYDARHSPWLAGSSADHFWTERSMLRNLAWQAADDLTRVELVMFNMLGDEIGLDQQDRQRALALDGSAWAAWTEFLAGGSLPAEPPLPKFLRRLATNAFSLALQADRQDLAA
jgi:hypothetical protein